MPPLPPVNKVLRVDFFLTVAPNTRVRDRMFLAFSGAGPTASDINTLATTISTSWNTNLSPQITNQVTLTGIQITDLTSATGAQIVQSQSRVGTRAGTGMPDSVAAIVKFKIARRYRGGHPRMYLPAGGGSDQANSQSWTGAFTSGLATAFGAFVTGAVASPPVNLGTLTHVNVSYFQSFDNKLFPSGRMRPVPRQRGTPLQDTVVSYSVNPLFGSQRRRNQQSP